MAAMAAMAAPMTRKINATISLLRFSSAAAISLARIDGSGIL
jgi:hypothetical protein